jgi:hypothetical protein
MSLPPRWNISIWEGDDYQLPLFLRDGDIPLDVSAGTWTAAWRKTPSDASETVVPIISTDANIGLIVVNFNAALTRTIAAIARVGWYDVQWNNGTTTKTYLRGTVKILQDVER